jgi:hypothetical protein
MNPLFIYGICVVVVLFVASCALAVWLPQILKASSGFVALVFWLFLWMFANGIWQGPGGLMGTGILGNAVIALLGTGLAATGVFIVGKRSAARRQSLR